MKRYYKFLDIIAEGGANQGVWAFKMTARLNNFSMLLLETSRCIYLGFVAWASHVKLQLILNQFQCVTIDWEFINTLIT